MGAVDPRLTRMFSATKDGIALPIIVTTRESPDQATLQAALRSGSGPIRSISSIGNSYATTATSRVAEAISQLPQTSRVYYDEPVSAI